MKKKRKLTEEELSRIYKKVYVDKTDYENLDSEANSEHLKGDYEIIGGIIYKKKDNGV